MEAKITITRGGRNFEFSIHTGHDSEHLKHSIIRSIYSGMMTFNDHQQPLEEEIFILRSALHQIAIDHPDCHELIGRALAGEEIE